MPFPQEFPDHRALTNLSRDEAERALAALRLFVLNGIASVYTSAGSRGQSWQVWLEISRRRMPLPEWAAHWLEMHGDITPPPPPPPSPEGPGDAA